MTASVEETRAGVRGSRLAAAVASEWTKLWSVRSTWLALLTAVGLGSLFPLILGVSARSSEAGQAVVTSATEAAGNGILILGQVALLALAGMTSASEYATGSIRTTLRGVPDRTRMLLSKALVLLPVMLMTGVMMTGVGVGVALAAMGPVADPLSFPEAGRIAAGAAIYLWLVGVVVVALGTVIRSVAGAITVALLLVLLVPMMLDQSGVRVLTTIAAGLPGSGGRILLSTAETEPYGVGGAMAVLLVWAVGAVAGASLLLRRRDG